MEPEEISFHLGFAGTPWTEYDIKYSLAWIQAWEREHFTFFREGCWGVTKLKFVRTHGDQNPET